MKVENKNGTSDYKVIDTYTLITPISQFELFLIHLLVKGEEEWWEAKLNRGYLDLFLKLDTPDGRERIKYYNKLEREGVFYNTINLDSGELLSGLRGSDDKVLETINSKWLLHISCDVEAMQRKIHNGR